ncbi:MAG: H(+)-transporting ATP synthase vacuolar type subunit [Bacteroidetes bacterium]|jgi:V/A-type H+-transporting ATPase subunit D|nr:MAG: H(+)-transporting ATP synthase vacuolar type subunit [Bacteroidota bacterium]PKP45462.1 MAG: V-type ATP synthase subunit D [Bacteroidetes bacterium HGW-Bacteroidetes-11]
MAIKFQYNKTSLQDLNKQLKVRVKALPTIKNKESALRMEVKKAKDTALALSQKLDDAIAGYQGMVRLWGEFDTNLVKVEDVELTIRKIAGVRIPVLEEVKFAIGDFSLFNNPAWFADGIGIVRELATIGIESEFFNRKMALLDHARRKTTQKVNLYEKVQIPGYEEAILKIKRFMEDEENLSKSAQKIVKDRQQRMEEEA